MFSKFTFGGLCLIRFESSVQCIVWDEVCRIPPWFGAKKNRGEYLNRDAKGGASNVFIRNGDR